MIKTGTSEGKRARESANESHNETKLRLENVSKHRPDKKHQTEALGIQT